MANHGLSIGKDHLRSRIEIEVFALVTIIGRRLLM